MTHKAKDCLERPRAKGARWTGKDIRADEVVTDINFNWEGKRDRWNGYNADDYKQVQERYAKIEAERKALRAEKLDRDLREGKKSRRNSDDNGSDDDDDDSEADFELGDADEKIIQQQAEGTKMSVRNLRIREDTAKYLYNLNTDSAYYDPKTRAMRADPTPHINPDDKDFAGDNFVRYTGDVTKLSQMELHTLQATESGRDLPHLQAEPSRAEALFKQFESKKKGLEDRRRADIAERYGGQEHAKPDPGIAGLDQSEAYVEYSRDGRIVKGGPVAIAVSKYPEDMYENKHTTVWGSFYKDGQWGYRCCHQMSRNAYCTGEAGKAAALATEADMKKRVEDIEAARKEKAVADAAAVEEKKRQDALKEPESEAEEERRKRRRVEEELRKQQDADAEFEASDRKRGYNWKSGGDDKEVTEEALEAFRIRQQLADDPMAKFLSSNRERDNDGEKGSLDRKRSKDKGKR